MFQSPRGFVPARQVASLTIASGLVAAGARFDAAMQISTTSKVLIGDRVGDPGDVYASNHYGDPTEAFTLVTNLGDAVANMIYSGAKGYVVIRTSEVFETSDGVSFNSLGVASSTTLPASPTILAYSMAVTAAGTLLVCDTKTGGGHIWRRATGAGSWTDIGAFSGAELYRLQVVGDGILCISFNGKVLKSTDDGENWSVVATLTSSPLYAIEYCGDGIVLIGDQDGKLWRSEDDGDTWVFVALLDGAADDMAYLGNGIVIYSTYNSLKKVYFSLDYGKYWRSLGPLATTAGDIWEHIIPVTLADGSVTCFGGTNLGYAARLTVS